MVQSWRSDLDTILNKNFLVNRFPCNTQPCNRHADKSAQAVVLVAIFSGILDSFNPSNGPSGAVNLVVSYHSLFDLISCPSS